MLNRIISYFLENRLVTLLILLLLVSWGIVTAPFGWQTGLLPSDPVPVDAIPDIGENQQIVFTEWKGRSPQDIDDQVTYPLTTWLLGIPGVKSVRSSSMFGFSSIFVIFDEDIEFYWSRSRILEKLSALPPGMLPEGVQPALGPDATALGQLLWYTIEGRDPEGNPTGGWDLHEIRTVQDFYVKYGLNAASGVSEVASIGGYVQEYQIDVNPDALQAYNIPLHKVMVAVQGSNRDVGARTIEINQAEYLVRGLGYIKSTEDIEKAVVTLRDNTPVRISDIGVVTLGPAPRRGALDKDGAGVVGGVVVARYGANPLQVINNVKDKIEEITPGMPEKRLSDGTLSKLTIIPFYDRSELIYETLGTLEEALILQIIIAILVVMVMVINLRASLLISSLLPVSVLIVFIAMRYFGVDANIVALSGIAIAIGTMVDLGIILSENVVKHLRESPPDQKLVTTIYNGASEVSSAILTAVSTTIVSFIPVFTMQHAEGKLFGPLAFTKSFALIAALIVSLFILPALAHIFLGATIKRRVIVKWINIMLIPAGTAAIFAGFPLGGIILIAYGLSALVKERYGSYAVSDNSGFANSVKRAGLKALQLSDLIIAVIAITWLLAKYWMPLGPSETLFTNFLFVGLLVALILGFFLALERFYRRILNWTLDHKVLFMSMPVILITLGMVIWIGFSRVFGFVEKGFDTVGVDIRTTGVWSGLTHTFPGIGREFMPSLDEGSFLLMPTTMPHSGMELNMKVLAQVDMLVTSIPEVELTVGKLGRVESALDPAPISMFENVINYKPEYALNQKGHRQKFRVDGDNRFETVDGAGYTNSEALENGIGPSDLVPDEKGIYFRNWRDHIRSSDDIWDEIVQVTRIPGLTSAPKLQPIETRLVMLQTGMRAPMGIKVYGPDLNTIEQFGLQLESVLKEVPQVKSESVFAERIVGKPYIHLNIDRDEISRYGLNIDDVQQTIETAIGGMAVSYTVEGRERFPVRVRYPRELRDSPEELGNILISNPSGAMIPLKQIVDIEYVRGPQAIKSEETFLVGYVLFDKRDGFSEVTVVEEARNTIQQRIDSGELTVPAGVSYKFSGNYENQVRAEKRLSIVVPVVLMIIFLILYFQFKSVSTSMMIFAGITMAFSGGFIMLWLYGQTWFADFSVLGTNLRDLFRIETINLSVAVWVGFIALFGIATDDGVLMGTYLDQSFKSNRPGSMEGIRKAVVEAGERRIKPAIMTSATTIIALLPVLTSTGRGSDIMIPMAIPAFGGMLLASITYFIVPVLYSVREERKLKRNKS